jgi:hypothetical protein
VETKLLARFKLTCKLGFHEHLLPDMLNRELWRENMLHLHSSMLLNLLANSASNMQPFKSVSHVNLGHTCLLNTKNKVSFAAFTTAHLGLQTFHFERRWQETDIRDEQ